jgi:hypothetical protein
VKKLLIATVTFTALFSSAAYAFGDVVIAAPPEAKPPGVPYIMPFVSDRTFRRESNFRPGPFHELRADERVEWRR